MSKNLPTDFGFLSQPTGVTIADKGETVVLEQTDVFTSEETSKVLTLEEGISVGELVEAAPGFCLAMSYNPGYQSVLKDLKQSTRQRFVAMRFDYPAAAEEVRIVANEAQVDAGLAHQVVKLGQALRRLEQHDLEEVASTRLLIFTARMIRSGMNPREACLACLAEPLSDDAQTVAALMDVVDVERFLKIRIFDTLGDV